jgi:hypothetical protein
MKKLITVLCLASVLLSATSCMRGGNADKGDGGRIGTDVHDTTKPHSDRKERKDRKHIMDTVEDLATDVERLPSRIRHRVGEAIKGRDNTLNNGHIAKESIR